MLDIYLLFQKLKLSKKLIAKSKLDSVSNLIRLDSINFEKAALWFSEDEQSRFNKGYMLNQSNTSTQFELEELIKEEYNVIKDLKLGEVSEPFESLDSKGKTVFKIAKVSKIIDAHKANLKDDYSLIENMTIVSKQQNAFETWLKERKLKHIFMLINLSLIVNSLKMVGLSKPV